MNSKFKQIISNAFNERACAISDVILPKNQRYINKKNHCNNLIDAIIKALPAEQQAIMEQYEEAMAELQNINDDIMYAQGVKDGIALARVLDIA